MYAKFFNVGLEFKNYFINTPCYLDTNKEPEPNTYAVCKTHPDNMSYSVIAHFQWNSKETCWEFKSIGTRYLEYYSEGLNEWLLKVMNMLECGIRAEDMDDQ